MQLPQFKNSQEAVDFGRKNREAIPELQKRAQGSEQRMNAAIILKDWTLGLNQAFLAQLDHEAIEAAEHPERETPLERLERQNGTV